MLQNFTSFLACLGALLAVAALGFAVSGDRDFAAGFGFGALVLMAPTVVRRLERRMERRNHRTAS